MNSTAPILPDDVLALARAQNEAYLIAFRAGYEAGFEAACKHATKIMSRPITDGIKAVKP
jgi:hypothetical protein